jgi:hypothetical protein
MDACPEEKEEFAKIEGEINKTGRNQDQKEKMLAIGCQSRMHRNFQSNHGHIPI